MTEVRPNFLYYECGGRYLPDGISVAVDRLRIAGTMVLAETFDNIQDIRDRGGFQLGGNMHGSTVENGLLTFRGVRAVGWALKNFPYEDRTFVGDVIDRRVRLSPAEINNAVLGAEEIEAHMRDLLMDPHCSQLWAHLYKTVRINFDDAPYITERSFNY